MFNGVSRERHGAVTIAPSPPGLHLDPVGGVSAVFSGEILEPWGAGFQCLQGIDETLRFSEIAPLNVVYQLNREF
ncbi:MAG: hypothetical protein WCA59_16130 [Candidatus Binataceae bacterium]